MICRARLKSFVFVVFVGTACLASCSSRSSQPTIQNANNNVVSETPPFQTKEPAHYKATRTLTITDSKGQSTTTKRIVARFDDLRREEFADQSSEPVIILDTVDLRLVLLPEAKIYSEVTGPESPLFDEEIDSSPEGLLHSDSIATTYQNLGVESVAGRTATKYRIVVNGSAAENVSSSETLMWIDESLGMPIRSETKGKDGSHMVIELTDIVLDIDKSLFQIPAGYEKVAVTELRRRMAKITK